MEAENFANMQNPMNSTLKNKPKPTGNARKSLDFAREFFFHATMNKMKNQCGLEEEKL